VDFDRLSPREYEDMAAVLLSRIHQAHRIGGSGGDGGRDCYFAAENGTHAYELNGFTGRMTPGRRQQVIRSLNRAMETSPRTWTLVTPISSTPAEQDWFDSLQTGISAEMDWRGKTWLEEQLAKYPDILRYIAAAANEVIRLLGVIGVLGVIGAQGCAAARRTRLAHRFAGAVSRLNEIDPFYQFEFTVTDGKAMVTAHTRYSDAMRDRPITASTSLRFVRLCHSRSPRRAAHLAPGMWHEPPYLTWSRLTRS
jgi:hypothetical protein